MIVEVKEIINIDSISTIRERFSEIENFTEKELEETIISEPQTIIDTVAKKAAKIDHRYFVLLKTEERLLAIHLGLKYFIVIEEHGIKRIEVCLGKQNAEERYMDYVVQVATQKNVSKKYFENENTKITFDICKRVAEKLDQFGFKIELIINK